MSEEEMHAQFEEWFNDAFPVKEAHRLGDITRENLYNDCLRFFRESKAPDTMGRLFDVEEEMFNFIRLSDHGQEKVGKVLAYIQERLIGAWDNFKQEHLGILVDPNDTRLVKQVERRKSGMPPIPEIINPTSRK